MPATIGATVRRPNAGNVQQTSGNNSSTGSRRARRSAARRRADRASSPSRRRVSTSGAPLRTWSAIARSSGRAGSPHWSDRSARTVATGTPRSTDRAADESPARACGGAQRASTGNAAGMVSPAPSDNRRRSITSGRSSTIGAVSVCARRRCRQRAASAQAHRSPSAGTTPTTRQRATARAHRPARASRTGSGARPAAVRRIRPSEVSGRGRGAGFEAPGRSATRAGLATGPIARSTATAAQMEMTVEFTRRAARAGASTSRRGRRGRCRPRCTPSPPVYAAGISPNQDRLSPTGR